MSLMERMARVRVLCVGDVMLDRFVSGSVKRISPESPVPVLSITGMNACPGGAANVARNVASLGGHCTLISVVGSDAVAGELERAVAGIAQVSSLFIHAPARATTEKIRFVAQGQHMLRADSEDSQPLAPELEQALLASIAANLDGHDVLVLSDYAKGVLTDLVVAGAIALARASGLPCVVDPKSARMERYAGATVVTPNAKEVQEVTGIDPTEDDAVAVAAGQKMLKDFDIEAVLVTRAHRGMTLVPREGLPAQLPASAREVFDVVGAGDTVVATLALVLGTGESLLEAARLANLAAGIVVGKRGTATVTQAELTEGLTRLGQGSLQSLQGKVFNLSALLPLLEIWRQQGHKVGFTNGCFDLLHVGHLSILSYSRSHCGRLVVGVNSDASVKRLKGADRPINSAEDRATVLAALAAVDAVVIFDEDTPLELIRAIQPDVLVKGADYSVDKIVGADLVLARGGQVLTSELIPGRSTSRIVDTLVKAR